MLKVTESHRPSKWMYIKLAFWLWVLRGDLSIYQAWREVKPFSYIPPGCSAKDAVMKVFGLYDDKDQP